MTSGDELRGGGRFSLTALHDPPRVVKRGEAAALAHEARALRALADRGIAPHLLAAAPGEITMRRVPGAPALLDHRRPDDLRCLGAALHALHASRACATGGRHVWTSRTRSLRAYAHRRLADVHVPRELTPLASTIADGFDTISARGPKPFRMLHGDLVEQNIVWSPRPVLVDWEFWRTGDPAEDLAYLFTVNDVGKRTEHAILAGYGEAAVAARIAPWRALCALDAGLWYRRHDQAERADTLLRRARSLAGG